MELIDYKLLADKLINQDFKVKAKGKEIVANVGKKKGYSFRWDNAKRRFGLCYYSFCEIHLSKPLVLANLSNVAKITDTILHEIAHAISYEYFGERGHGRVWKSIARQIGSNGNRCFSYDRDNVNPIQGKYTLKCESCGGETPRHKKPKYKMSCGICAPKVYNSDFQLSVIQNY